ncbi:hypothetical protein IPH19_04235 [Candidatus Uhrbacteria bacterium]|nr:MAG: hypothetical protein IPH19_04235 [Candidatus Uhrbacteria bacterium]
MSIERPEVMQVTERLESRALAHFPANRLTWTDADFEKAHKKMRELPHVGERTALETLKVLETLSESLSDSEGEAWKTSIETFAPEQVLMRYGYGADWSYAFHEQRRYMEGETVHEKDHATESSVTGIGKKVVRGLGKIVKEAKRELDETTEAEDRKRIEKSLVDDAGRLFDAVYQNETGRDRIQVIRLDGPRGPVYLCVQNGNHRLAAARLIGLRRVRGEVQSCKDGKGLEHWYDFLAALPPGDRQIWQVRYNELYPATEADWVKDDRELEAAAQRHVIDGASASLYRKDL